MLRYLLPLVAAGALHAGITDFHTLSEAKSAYENGDYAKASKYYGALRHKNDAARYDYGDALYQQKKYKEAAQVFSEISSPGLKQKALHNLGNSLALSGKTDDAIKAYEAALKLGEDKDTRYNLDLLKKQKQQQQHKKRQDGQKQQNSQNQKNDQHQNGQGRENQQQQNGQGKNDQQKNDQQQNAQGKESQQEQQNRNAENNQPREGQAQTKQEEEQKAQKQQGQNPSDKAAEDRHKAQQAQQTEAQKASERQQNAQQAQAAMAAPISDMEERKYNKMLDKRGIKTLMIPLSGKGEPHADETTPW